MRRPRARVLVGLAVVTVLGVAGCRSAADVGAPATPAATAAVSGSITVSAASSLTDVFTTIARGFSRVHPGARVTLNFGSSSVLATQIEQGAPADTLAAADPEAMDALVAADLVAGSPTVFARNRLTIVTKVGNPKGIRSVADLADAGTVSLCASTAPCGKYTARVLVNAGVTIPESAVTRGTDARSTIAAVISGDADAAIVYVTDANAAGRAVTTVPIALRAEVVAEYPIATLASSGAPAVSAAFIEYVRSPRGQSVLRAAGFLPAAPAP